MTEEEVTKKILSWLIENQWEIVCFDFPQSGTGKYLHPNQEFRNSQTKNSAAFIPDIVVVKGENVLFFENKNRFYLDDFVKLSTIRENNIYTDSINNLLSRFTVSSYYYGIGVPDTESFITKSTPYQDDVDFIVLVTGDEISIYKGEECFEAL